MTVADNVELPALLAGTPPKQARARREELLAELGLKDKAGATAAGLSGGEQQRVALGAVMTSQPRVLVLDEPTSALDPAAAEDVLAAITRLVHDLGLTVLLAEHRLERVVQYADRVISLSSDGAAAAGWAKPAARSATRRRVYSCCGRSRMSAAGPCSTVRPWRAIRTPEACWRPSAESGPGVGTDRHCDYLEHVQIERVQEPGGNGGRKWKTVASTRGSPR